MTALRIVGLLLLATATVSLGYQFAITLSGSGGGLMTSLGEQWGSLDAPSLNLIQAVTQRYVHPALWDPVLVTFLLLPAWLVLGVPGLVLFLFAQRPWTTSAEDAAIVSSEPLQHEKLT